MALLFVANQRFLDGAIVRVLIADILCYYLVTVSRIDFQHRIIPDELSLSLWGFGLLISVINPYLSGTPLQKGVQSVAASLSGGVLMLFLAWMGEKAFKKEALGGGDVKLVAAFAALLGWPGIFGPVLFGSLFGGLVGIALLLLKKKKMGEALPFGPFLSAGAFVTYFFPAWVSMAIIRIVLP